MNGIYSLQPNCSVCGINLNKNGQILMIPVGKYINLTCPKCGIIWRFWIQVTTNQKKIGQKQKRINI